MNEQPQKEHQWLEKLVGRWSYEVEALGDPPTRLTGTETVRSLGGLWIVAEGEGEMPGGGRASTMLTIGYGPKKRHYIGTWIGSMMTQLWVYEGELDEAKNMLTLKTEGPHCTVEGATAKYKEVIQLKDDRQRVFSSHILGDDGQWQCIMTAHYRRTK